jgi:exodeoxyribonuclease V alpha subunit
VGGQQLDGDHRPARRLLRHAWHFTGFRHLGQEIAYDFDELDELAHAYAVTIHRSQGSEYPAVVIPVTTSAWMMLQRNLLYTGITRAKKLVVLAGSRRALAAAVRTPGAGRRHTALTHRLQTLV